MLKEAGGSFTQLSRGIRRAREIVPQVAMLATLAVVSKNCGGAPSILPALSPVPTNVQVPHPCFPQGVSYVCKDALVTPSIPTQNGQEQVIIKEYKGGTTPINVGDQQVTYTSDTFALNSAPGCIIEILSTTEGTGEVHVYEVDEIC